MFKVIHIICYGLCIFYYAYSIMHICILEFIPILLCFESLLFNFASHWYLSMTCAVVVLMYIVIDRRYVCCCSCYYVVTVLLFVGMLLHVLLLGCSIVVLGE